MIVTDLLTSYLMKVKAQKCSGQNRYSRHARPCMKVGAPPTHMKESTAAPNKIGRGNMSYSSTLGRNLTLPVPLPNLGIHLTLLHLNVHRRDLLLQLLNMLLQPSSALTTLLEGGRNAVSVPLFPPLPITSADFTSSPSPPLTSFPSPPSLPSSSLPSLPSSSLPSLPSLVFPSLSSPHPPQLPARCQPTVLSAPPLAVE